MTKKEKYFYNNILLKIHDEIFNKMSQKYIDVFLCGGASSKKKTSVRDKIREGLREFENIRVLYPEDLFIDMLNKNKDYDLLSLERFLANNCDIICIVCESAGSLVELGAFTNNDNTVDKVIALLEEKRKRQKSFIMLGPVKILRHIGKERVIFYNDELEGINEKLKKTFENKMIKTKGKKEGSYKPINTLIGLYYFLPITLYFFKKIDVELLTKSLKVLFNNKGYTIEDFDTLFRPTLKLLYKGKFISKNIIEGKTAYTLTENGYKMVNELLGEIDIKDKNALYDRIRFGIIRNEYYRSS
ncbi:retron St85 family effector protein [Peribacillus sp. NPDC097895]|uniref:retron St85 family effector protein n=1 Tax=Peribacillus sp. NPDC097895 TaxID=3390619 RepID=UPI003D028582